MHALAPYPFHAGEQEMQMKAGSWQEVESMGRRMIKPAVNAVQGDLLRQLPLLLVTGSDAAGRTWASALVGSPGFVSVAPDPSVLRISSARLLGDGALTLLPGQQVGCLGILLSSRRRVRVNGTLQGVERGPGGLLELRVRVEQAYGNCPKYIQKRTLEPDAARQARLESGGTPAAERGSGALGAAQQAVVAASDTFFIASSSGPPPPPSGGGSKHSTGSLPAAAEAYGYDISHRGGPPGFVQVEDGGRALRWGDFEGNYMFMTLGNLLLNPACALLFLDFQSGDALLLRGEAEVLHKDRQLPGAQRAVRFVVDEWMHLPAALPLKAVGEVGYSPFNPPASTD
ncbi:hypothetical protein ABPG75_013792 [Micractinium tetrahymenae]